MTLADKFELAPDLVTKVKLGLHILHTIVAFVIFVLEIVLFTKPDAKITGNNGWTFAVGKLRCYSESCSQNPRCGLFLS